jgi:tRNA pseudouridine55 synthase
VNDPSKLATVQNPTLTPAQSPAPTQARAPKSARRKVNGVLLVDKPVGPSSQQVVGLLKRLYNAEKVGHGGTLDPLASGLLIIGFGEATKFLQRHLDGDKRYLATLRLGAQTTTGDTEGDIIARTEVIPAAQIFTDACKNFVGYIEQMPPQFSALKIAGKPAYAYARAGEAAPLKSRTIRIDEIRVIDLEGDTARIEVACGKGTYIRTLAEDIAIAAGSLAHLTGLRRLASGGLHVDQAHDLDALKPMTDVERDAMLLLPLSLLGDTPRLQIPAAQIQALSEGKRLPWNGIPGQYAVMNDEVFHGIAICDGEVMRVLRWMSS